MANVSKHRYSREGVGKVVEEGKWGRSKARERYGQLDYDEQGAPRPATIMRPRSSATPTICKARTISIARRMIGGVVLARARKASQGMSLVSGDPAKSDGEQLLARGD